MEGGVEGKGGTENSYLCLCCGEQMTGKNENGKWELDLITLQTKVRCASARRFVLRVDILFRCQPLDNDIINY